MGHTDAAVRRLMRNLRLLAGCDALLTAMSGGHLVDQILALTERTAEDVARDARQVRMTVRQDPRRNPGGDH